MARLMFNEDPNHFVFTRAKAGITDVTREYARDFIRQYKDSAITDFIICTGASSPWYKSKLIPSILDKYDIWVKEGKIAPYDEIKDDTMKCVAASVKIYESFFKREGMDLQQLWIDELRNIGIKPWISIRMNDIHNASEKGAFLHSDFFDAHPEYGRAQHRGALGYFDYALDFTHKEVRDYYENVVRDSLETFDADGIEFDWMREIYCSGIGKEEESLRTLTEFQGKLCAIVKEYEKKRGHLISVAVRMPHSIEKALRLGFDIIEWVNRGYTDIITVTPRWSSIDNNMPLDVWKRVFAGKNVEIVAGLEVLLDSYNRRGKKYKYNTLETARASACAYLGMGADGIYLFNYMDAVENTEETKVFSDPETYKKLLSSLSDYKTLLSSGRRHVCTFTDVYATGSDIVRMLPFGISGKDGKANGFGEVRIPTGDIPESARVKIVIGLERPVNISADRLTVYANTRRCALKGAVPCPENSCELLDYYEFEAENDGNLSKTLTVEVGITEGGCTVGWAEADIIQ